MDVQNAAAVLENGGGGAVAIAMPALPADPEMKEAQPWTCLGTGTWFAIAAAAVVLIIVGWPLDTPVAVGLVVGGVALMLVASFALPRLCPVHGLENELPRFGPD